MNQDSSRYRRQSRVELRAAGFEPDRAAQTKAVVTVASAHTNAHRCNNRVGTIADLLVGLLAERGGQGLIGIFPLITNDRQIKPADVLAAYKYQPNLERRHSQLKGHQLVEPGSADPSRLPSIDPDSDSATADVQP